MYYSENREVCGDAKATADLNSNNGERCLGIRAIPQPNLNVITTTTFLFFTKRVPWEWNQIKVE